MQEFPKWLYARGVEPVLVESQAEQDELDPALWFATPDSIPEVKPEAEEAEVPEKRGPGRPRKV